MTEPVFKEERFVDIIEELRPITQRHWQEVALYQDRIKLDVNWASYAALQARGLLSCVTVRVGGVLVGYCIDVLAPHPHYQTNLFAVNDVLYVDKHHRKALTGVKLLKFAETVLRGRGVEVWVIHTKEHLPISSVLKRLGFGKIEEQYGKYLGDS